MTTGVKKSSLRDRIFGAVLRKRTKDLTEAASKNEVQIKSGAKARSVPKQRGQRPISRIGARTQARMSGKANPSAFELYVVNVLPGQRARFGQRIERYAEDMPMLAGSQPAGYKGKYLGRRVRV